MKYRVIALVLLLTCRLSCWSVPLEFTFSKPYALLHFIGSISDPEQASGNLISAFRESKIDNAVSRQYIARFRALPLQVAYNFAGYPSSRFQTRSLKDILMAQAAGCTSLVDLRQRMGNHMPAQMVSELFEVLEYFDPLYSEWIWNERLPHMQHFRDELDLFARSRGLSFFTDRLAWFYGTAWPASQVVKVCLVPLPGSDGHSMGHAYGSTIDCEVLQGETQYAKVCAQVVHELGHLLFREQPSPFQHRLEQWFSTVPRKGQVSVYPLMDEALATASANGYLSYILTGKIPSDRWYNDPEIDRLSKALYPHVKRYIQEQVIIDSAFIALAQEAYQREFPLANQVPSHLFSAVHLVVLGELQETSAARNLIRENFDPISLRWTTVSDRLIKPTPSRELETTIIWAHQIGRNKALRQIKYFDGLLPMLRKSPAGGGYCLLTMVGGSRCIWIETDSYQEFQWIIQHIKQKPHLPYNEWISLPSSKQSLLKRNTVMS
ncbi:MAG TPA: hypothetical protein VFV37_05905 [Luteibaculaceae bacterium]|nr:hypothetical protein [Luteibaculaceae bacterium]